MNDLYTRDRMERNLVDYEGCGIGSGRFDKREEKREKLRELQLPLVLLAVIVIPIAALVAISAKDIYYMAVGTKVEAEVIYTERNLREIIWTAPNGQQYMVKDNELARIKEGKVAAYYIDNDYSTITTVTRIEYWVAQYIFFALCVIFLLVWIKKTLIRKKHAVERPVKTHSYKDY